MEKLLEALKSDDREKIEELASELFITNEGRCNWENMIKFEDLYGYKIVPLERDSFGWLIGGIKYEDKIYSFG